MAKPPATKPKQSGIILSSTLLRSPCILPPRHECAKTKEAPSADLLFYTACDTDSDIADTSFVNTCSHLAVSSSRSSQPCKPNSALHPQPYYERDESMPLVKCFVGTVREKLAPCNGPDTVPTTMYVPAVARRGAESAIVPRHRGKWPSLGWIGT